MINIECVPHIQYHNRSSFTPFCGTHSVSISRFFYRTYIHKYIGRILIFSLAQDWTKGGDYWIPPPRTIPLRRNLKLCQKTRYYENQFKAFFTLKLLKHVQHERQRIFYFIWRYSTSLDQYTTLQNTHCKIHNLKPRLKFISQHKTKIAPFYLVFFIVLFMFQVKCFVLLSFVKFLFIYFQCPEALYAEIEKVDQWISCDHETIVQIIMIKEC